MFANNMPINTTAYLLTYLLTYLQWRKIIHGLSIDTITKDTQLANLA